MGNKFNLNIFFNYLTRPVDASSLSIFRFLFGIIMVWSTLKYFYRGWIKYNYIDQNFYFTYEWFHWIAPLPGNGMYWIFGFIATSALFLALGLLYRISAIIFFLSYTYVFLIDKTLYNNHYYLISLLGFLFCFTNAHGGMSVDNLWRKKFRPDTQTGNVPFWNILIFKSQIFIVYFYGGIAKINLDWLKGEPMRHWLVKGDETPEILTRILESEFSAYFFSYGGIIFDLGIGFLLLYRKTRLFGFILLLVFNLTNNWLFTIGIFPFLMIATTVLFLEPETPRSFLQNYFSKFKSTNIYQKEKPSPYQKLAITFFCLYLCIQILIPFRHLLYSYNTSWSEEGHYFAWRMKLRDKSNCQLGILASNPDSGNTWVITGERHISERQYKDMCKSPNLIIQYAHFLGQELKILGISNPVITVRTLVSLNFREPQPMIDPNVNLVEAEYLTFKSADWILPLKD
ncbi:MAG: HTTM domain-containing protein [Nitrospinales bacterium]